MKATKTVKVYSGERYDSDWPPEEAAEFMRWVQEKLDSIPPEYRDRAEISIDSIGGYEGEHHPSITISFVRPETDAEHASRLAEDERRRKFMEERDLRLLAELRAKYGQ